MSHSQSLDTLLSADPAPAVQAIASDLHRRLDAVGGNLVLAGSGELGRATLKAVRQAGLNPVAFTDNNAEKSGTEVSGVPVMTPVEAVRRFQGTSLFAITVYTSGSLWTQFRGLGVEPISFARLAWTFPASFMPYYSVDDPQIIPRNAVEIRRLFGFWTDDASRAEYLAQLQWRTTLDPEVLGGQCPPADTLFAPDLISLTDHESFVDCGAFDGDTLAQFLARTKGRFKSIAAFEPDALNFARLEKLAADLPGGQPATVHLFQNALGSAPGRTRFDFTGTVGSTLGSGEGWVEVVTLDQTAGAFAPTFIKMDIEGSEPEAIRGASEIIRRHQPILAVCLYHATRHLWEIPLLIKDLLPAYRLYLRRYSNDCWEQICYAIPPHRSIAP
ncbi:MAG: FkbM family methyltransferase [Chthoniobacteraceae bacterium]|jgi:FkbM family methyltransferase